MKRYDRQGDETRIGKPEQAQKIPDRLQASIVIVDGLATGMEYAVTKTYTIIGRDDSVDITPHGDSQISRRHAVIVYLDGSYILKDLDSTNGTIMDGALIKQAYLRHGDKFRIGQTTFQFILQHNPRNTTLEIG